MRMGPVTVYMKPGPGLEEFLAAQRDPSSPDYRRWLTPEEFGERFGLGAGDLAKVREWLASCGLEVRDVARGRHWITFGGTAAAVGRALGTRIRRFAAGGETHWANADEPSVPAALASVVAGFTGLDDFATRSHASAAPLYTAGNGGHYLAPDDFATVYDLGRLYAAGVDASGVKIAVIGRTAVLLSDIQDFRKRFNLPAKDPQLVLYGTDPGLTADHMEASLDLEWSGAVARNADLIYVYAQTVELAAQYAIDRNLAPVVTESYGACEPSATPAFRVVAQQANAQGITWLAGAGDTGAATCDQFAPSGVAAKGLTASFPATIPEVTAVGGTAFGDSGGSYWSRDNSATLASALSYIPEKAWNESEAGKLLAGGGGASALFPKPAWQTGPGVPDDNARDVPDVALAASLSTGYIIQLNGGLYAAGGTSATAPAFAGVVALLNHYLISKGAIAQPGLGNINPVLYRMAQTAPEAFHDVTDGDNRVPCLAGSPGCSGGQLGFSAGPGYDLATGLGSIDAWNLFTRWDGGVNTVTSLTAAPASANPEDTVQLAASVTAAGGADPGGSVTFVSDGQAVGTAALAGGSAAVAVPAYRLTTGDGTVLAAYGGDGQYNPSSGTARVTLLPPASGNSLVVASAPSPVYAQMTALGLRCPVTVKLVEKAGVSSSLTRLLVDGGDASAQIAELFGGAAIPANGSLSASLLLGVPAQPADSTLEFSGVDAGGAAWTRKVTVTLAGTAAANPVYPGIRATAAPANVPLDPKAEASCAWSYRLTVEETGGFAVQLTKFSAGAGDRTSQIPALFGTASLAPWGKLSATVCEAAGTAPPWSRDYTIQGTAEDGTLVGSTVTVSFTGQ